MIHQGRGQVVTLGFRHPALGFLTYRPGQPGLCGSRVEFERTLETRVDGGIAGFLSLAYGSGPFSPANMAINHRGGGRGFYFKDPNGHLLEVLTV